MPRREDIEKFKEILNSLGSEPEIMARRSQAIEEVTPPEEARPPEAPAGGGAEEAPTPEAGAETAPDFGLDLANLPDIESEPAPIEVPPEPVPTPSEEGAEAGGLDFSSLFAEETAAPPIQELEIPPAEEQFQLPESEAAALQSDLSQMEQVPEEPPREPAAGGEGEALPGSFEDIGSFELESPEAASAPPSEEAMAGIELPNLEDLSLAEPAAGAAAEEAPVPAAFEEAPLDMGAPAEEPGLEAPSFEIPSLEEAGAGAVRGAAR